MKVRNVNKRRQNSCGCGTWLDHWGKVCGEPLPQHCAATACMAKPQLGAYVQSNNTYDSNWYIIPLCVKHSISAASLEIDDTTTLVSAHVNETCGKQMPIGNVWPHDLQTTIEISTLKHEADAAKAQILRGAAKEAKPQLYSKRKVRREEAPALRVAY
jgi:hypothetical protein